MSDPNAGLPPMPAAPPGGIVTALDVGAAQGFGPPPAAKELPKVPEEKQAEQISERNNPAESLEDATKRMELERGSRMSLNAPTRRLEVPPIPGYHLHWFLERNIPRAIAGWYEFVRPEEAPTADRTIAGRTAGTTSEDLGGARIAQIGGTNEMGLPEHLVLMKIRQEWYFAEQRKIAERNLSIIQQVFHKKAPVMSPEESQTDYGMRYTREAVIDMSNGRFRKVDQPS